MTKTDFHLFQYLPTVTPDPNELTLFEVIDAFADGGKIVDTTDLKAAAIGGSLIVAQANPSGEVIGALTLREWFATDTVKLNKHLPPSKQVHTDPPALHLLDLAVRHQWRGLGVAMALVETAFNNHKYNDKKEPYGRVFATSRVPKDGSGPTSYGLLRRLGFEELVRNENHYRNLGPEDFQCPHCDPYGDGTPLCACLGVQMLWTRLPEEKIEEEEQDE
jgi:ribosomal protein S18 acetylase RimI-like enzyme